MYVVVWLHATLCTGQHNNMQCTQDERWLEGVQLLESLLSECTDRPAASVVARAEVAETLAQVLDKLRPPKSSPPPQKEAEHFDPSNTRLLRERSTVLNNMLFTRLVRAAARYCTCVCASL